MPSKVNEETNVASTPKRVLVIDFNHLAHIYMNGMQDRMTANINGQVVDTTIAAMAAKTVFRWANQDNQAVAICMDSPCPARKAFFKEQFAREEAQADGGYKGDRVSAQSSLFQGIDMFKAHAMGSVSMYQGLGYEADDLVGAVITASKEAYGNIPIDVVTNDTDLLPLVNDQISIFLRSKQGTSAVSKHLEKNKYVQVTPENYSEELGRRSAFKDMGYIPYNAVLLLKLLRGDDSDNIPGDKRRFPPRLVKEMLADLQQTEGGSDIFRFHNWAETALFLLRYLDTDKDREVMERIHARYVLSDLNNHIQVGDLVRKPARVRPPERLNEIDWRKSFQRLRVNFPLV